MDAKKDSGGLSLTRHQWIFSTMRIRSLLIAISFLSFTSSSHALADSYVVAPVLEKIYINSDALQAVLYWTPSHSAPDNPIYDYAATYDGANYSSLSVNFQNKYQTTIALPTRANKTNYFFAVAPILKNGLGPVSNIIKGEITPYVIPIGIGTVVPTTEGFTFEIKDLALPGYSGSTQYSVSDIFGSETAYWTGESKSGRFEIRGLKKGESASVTVYKKVGNCPGFSVSLACPFSTATVVTGRSLQEVSPPKFGTTQSLSDGFTSSILNFDAGVTYLFDAPDGVTASVDENGLIEVHGLESSTEIKLLVRASHEGLGASSNTLYGKSLQKAYIPTFGSAKSTKPGFIIKITNFNSKYEHKVTSNVGKVSVNSTGAITVSGLGPGVSANITLEIYSGDDLIHETTLTGKSLNKKK